MEYGVYKSDNGKWHVSYYGTFHPVSELSFDREEQAELFRLALMEARRRGRLDKVLEIKKVLEV